LGKGPPPPRDQKRGKKEREKREKERGEKRKGGKRGKIEKIGTKTLLTSKNKDL